MKTYVLQMSISFKKNWHRPCLFIVVLLAFSYSVQGQTALESFEAGDEAFWNGRYTNALMAYNKAIQKDTTKALYYLHRANTYFQMRKYPQAIKDYTRAIEKDPYNVKAFNMRGRSRYLLKDYDGAVKDYDMATALKKEKGKNSLKGWEYTTTGSYEMACINWIEQLKRGYDNHLDINAMRQWAKAILATDTISRDMEVLNTEVVAMTYYAQEDYDKSLVYLKKADALIATLPMTSAYTMKYLEELDFNLYYVYAGILLHREQYDESIKMFEKIAKWDSKNNLPFYALAQAHFYKNEPEVALDYLQQALSLGFVWADIQRTPDFYEGLRNHERFIKMERQYTEAE